MSREAALRLAECLHERVPFYDGSEEHKLTIRAELALAQEAKRAR
jgi:hypothetical protein